MNLTIGAPENGNVLMPSVTFPVLDDGRRVGTVMQVHDGRPGTYGTYRVFDAGMGVHDDQPRLTFPTVTEAAARIAVLRATSPATAVEDGLTGAERAILDVEALSLPTDGRKQTAIRERLGITDTRYYQVLTALVGRPEASAYAPDVVARLQARLDERQARRRSMRALLAV